MFIEDRSNMHAVKEIGDLSTVSECMCSARSEQLFTIDIIQADRIICSIGLSRASSVREMLATDMGVVRF